MVVAGRGGLHFCGCSSLQVLQVDGGLTKHFYYVALAKHYFHTTVVFIKGHYYTGRN